MVPLLCLRSLRQGGRIFTSMPRFEYMAKNLFSYVNVHCTNLLNSWAGYSPTSKWCPPKPLRRLQAIQQVVSTEDSICWCSPASLCINIRRPGWAITSLLISKVILEACGKLRILSFFFSGKSLNEWLDMFSGTWIRQHEMSNMIYTLTVWRIVCSHSGLWQVSDSTSSFR